MPINSIQMTPSFLDNIPHTNIEAGELIQGNQGPIGSWYVRDRQLQSDIPRLDLGSGGNADLNQTLANLAEFETFAYTSAAAVASCNGGDAQRDIKVAKAFLDEAHKEFHGQGTPDWQPPGEAEGDTEHVAEVFSSHEATGNLSLV